MQWSNDYPNVYKTTLNGLVAYYGYINKRQWYRIETYLGSLLERGNLSDRFQPSEVRKLVEARLTILAGEEDEQKMLPRVSPEA